ncbi:MtrB/PioB family decaheme-associated outer membrane protein [Ideonella sp. A 288]|uniref:MtrB/PioB family decaheme-associated outer membrane protein n=1 Tax=Ideonella sp. A 288 TaxID=1962181 RepID=UPI000B4BA624|nr:MtrB/PioB family decaheme-associated outer membrane protein [Ideonella sp. A 288]
MTPHVHTSGLRLTLVSMAVLAACFAARAQDIKPLEASVTIGLGLIDGDSRDRAQFGQYNGLRNDRNAFGLLGFDYDRHLAESDQWLRLIGTNLLGDTRELSLVWQRFGQWRISADFGQSVRADPYTVNTGLLGAGTTTPQLVALTGGAGSGADLDLKVKRTGLGLGLSTWFTPDLQIEVNLKSEDKKGMRLFGVGINCPSPSAPGCRFPTGAALGWATLLLPEPIDSNHSQVEARLSYSKDQLHLSAGYYGSFYRNTHASLTAAVPGSLNNVFGTPLPLNTGLQALLGQAVALSPDNQAHQVDVSGQYDFSRTTRATFKLAYSTATQTQDFAGAGFTSAPVGVANLGGEVDTTMVRVGITSRPMPKLSLAADLRYEDKNDKTPIALYNLVGTTTYTNRRLPQRKVLGKVQAGWQFSSDYRGSLSAEAESIDRGVFTATSAVSGLSALRQDTDETTLRGELRRRLSEDVSGAISLSRSSRDGSNWLRPNSGVGVTEVSDVADPASGLTLGSVFMPTLADRTRDKARLFVDWQPSEELALQFSAEEGKDRFDVPTAYGLQRTRMSQLSVDWSYALTDTWKLNGYLSRSVQTLNQARYQGAVMAFDNTSANVGVGFAGKVSGVEVGGSLSYVDDKSVYAQTLDVTADAYSAASLAASGGLPDILFRQTAIKLFGRHVLDKQASIRVDLVHQRSRVNDWTWGYNGVPFTYSDGSTLLQNPVQKVSVIGVSYTYQWK